jgi:Ser-tRNA(Ala) deacylase AlaX
VVPRKRQKFVGYETTSAETEILAFRQGSDLLELVLHENPFYAESGGQVSDTGLVKGEGWTLPVEDVIKAEGKQVVVGPHEGPFEPTAVEASVAEERRRNIERNHSATHLVHHALRKVLGAHVRQAGSVVAPDRLRFDFSHHAPVKPEELDAIEEEVNEHIWENVAVETHIMSYKDAIAAGAIAFFGDKYGDVVRVVDMPGVTMELCGGTHVRSTGQIGLFHFAGETGVAAGVRRIEAMTGPVAYTHVKSLGERIEEAAGTLRTAPEHLARRIEGLLDEKKRLEKQVEELLKEGGGGRREQYEKHRFGDVALFIGDAPVSDRGKIGLLMDSFRDEHKGAIQVLFVTGERRKRRPRRWTPALRLRRCGRSGEACSGTGRGSTNRRRGPRRSVSHEEVLAWLEPRLGGVPESLAQRIREAVTAGSGEGGVVRSGQTATDGSVERPPGFHFEPRHFFARSAVAADSLDPEHLHPWPNSVEDDLGRPRRLRRLEILGGARASSGPCRLRRRSRPGLLGG